MSAIGRLDLERWQAFRDAKAREDTEELRKARRRLVWLNKNGTEDQYQEARELEKRIAERTRESRPLHDQLVKDNEPLTVVLTAQLCGRGENRPGRKQKFKRVAYVENLSPEDQEAAGRIGMAKAISKFDPKIRDKVRAAHGLEGAVDEDGAIKGLPAFAAYRIMYELQQAIEKSGCMTVRRGCAPQNRPGVERLDDPEHVERVLTESDAYMARGGESDQERWAREEAEEAAPQGPKRVASALEDFLANRCVFKWPVVTMRNALFGAYERHARILSFPVVSTRALEKALLSRHRVVLQSGNAGEGRVGMFFRGVALTTLSELTRRVNVASV